MIKSHAVGSFIINLNLDLSVEYGMDKPVNGYKFVQKGIYRCSNIDEANEKFDMICDIIKNVLEF